MYDKILIANDGSQGAARALSAAIKLAKIHDAELHMICVEEMPRFPASIDEVIEEKRRRTTSSTASHAGRWRKPRRKGKS